jgi:hypothetical protein
MKTRHWLAGGTLLVGLLTWTAHGEGQPLDKPTPGGLQAPLSIDPPVISTPSVSSLVPPSPPTMDQLIDTLTSIRAKKAELEKQEQATIVAIQEKMRMQRERLRKIGIGTDEPPTAPKFPDTEVPLRK